MHNLGTKKPSGGDVRDQLILNHVEHTCGYFSSVFTREDIRSLPVPDAKFQVKSELERLIKGHMVDFLVRHKLLNPSQHGLLKKRSCLINVIFLEEING